MKSVFLFSLLGVFILSIAASPLVFGASYDIKPPRQQIEDGVAPKDVVCKSGYALMLRTTGGAACVKPSTAERLADAGWGTIEKKASMEKDHVMEEKEMMQDSDKMMEKESISVAGIDVSMASPLEGSPDAPITIIEFGDFQCPKCNQWFQNEKETIAAEFIKPGVVKLYFLDFTFLGDDSITAAQASYCAQEQDMYWRYHTHLYNNQGEIQGGWASDENLKEFASEVGLDTEEFSRCLDSGKYSQRISHNTAVGAAHDVEGTPVFFIVGPEGSVKRIDGPQPASVFVSVIDSLG